MFFINREEERTSFKRNYEANIQNKTSQVYIIEANHGVGKTEFIREVSKYFSYNPLDIYQAEENEELSIFKRLVLELDKTSNDYGYDSFKTFYKKRTNNTKAIRLLLKISAIFGLALAKTTTFDVDLASLMDFQKQPENFILNAQIENLFEYAQYVFETSPMHIIFHHALFIDSGTLDLLSKLIATSKESVFIFECDNEQSSSKIEQHLKNSHSFFYKKYPLEKLSNSHIQTYIQQLLSDLQLEADKIDSNILKTSIEKGDLAEISSILRDFNDRLQKDTSCKIRSTKEILQSLSREQNLLLILIGYANGKLNLTELKDIMIELSNSFNISDLDLLWKKNIIDRNNDWISLLPFVYEVFNEKEYMPNLKYVVASALVKNLNIKLNKRYNNRYIDVLVEYYIGNKQFRQLKSLLSQIDQRLKNFNTQAERIGYFKKFEAIRLELYKNDENFANIFAKIAYNANLYYEAMNFIDLANELNDDIIFIKAIVLNRCEKFVDSKDYIILKLKKYDKQTSMYFKLSLVLIMNLIQLNERDKASKIFNELISYTKEPLYPYLIRLSNVFYHDFNKRLEVVNSITKDFYRTNDNEFSGLHAVYLSYLYALTKQPEQAEKALIVARNFFGNNLIYNHMILHNEATIKFHNNEIDEDIPTLLNNAKITAYDEYDKFAINNNLLVYYILSDNMSKLECQDIALELENMLSYTGFKRFVDKIYYNLYHYYKKMFNYEKSEYYKNKLLQMGKTCNNNYTYKLIYETSWKLPIT